MGPQQRESILQTFNYPEFTESERAFCLRLGKSTRGNDLVVKGLAPNFQLLVSPPETAEVEFAGITGAWSELKSLFRESDWVAVTISENKEIERVQLLAPCLEGSESAFRNSMISRTTLEDWNLFLKTVREFFGSQGFLEVQTPTLVTCPGTEPFLDVFETEFRQGRKTEPLFLPTSPELHLKKLVAEGYGPLFEIRPCFRNGEISELHQPEFWMLEWYRHGQTLTAIETDCRNLIQTCIRVLGRRETPSSTKDLSNREVPLVTKTSMRELFLKFTNFDLLPETTAAELVTLAQSLKLPINPHSDFDDAFYYLFLEKIEPYIPHEQLTFLSDYPPSQAALARLTRDGWGDRFEMYWKGMELANAYHELNDPKIQRQRSKEDLEKRQRLGKQKIQLDESFFKALEAGMPPTSGIALGLERLFLALTGRKSLQEIRLFPM